MFKRFPEYDFSLTDSTQGLEVIMGYRRSVFKQVIATQRRAFNNAPRTLRPGALMSINFKGEWVNILFLHSASGANKKAYELRQRSFNKIWSLQKVLTKASPSNKPNLIVLGDLNTMGNGKSVSGSDEIRNLQNKAKKNRMTMLTKDSDNTYHEWGKGPRDNRRRLRVNEIQTARRSNLDHVLANDYLNFVIHGDDDTAPIHVEGWQQLSGRHRVNFLWSLSDHSALYGQVQ